MRSFWRPQGQKGPRGLALNFRGINKKTPRQPRAPRALAATDSLPDLLTSCFRLAADVGNSWPGAASQVFLWPSGRWNHSYGPPCGWDVQEEPERASIRRGPISTWVGGWKGSGCGKTTHAPSPPWEFLQSSFPTTKTPACPPKKAQVFPSNVPSDSMEGHRKPRPGLLRKHLAGGVL